jgi:hypothetical protein
VPENLNPATVDYATPAKRKRGMMLPTWLAFAYGGVALACWAGCLVTDSTVSAGLLLCVLSSGITCGIWAVIERSKTWLAWIALILNVLLVTLLAAAVIEAIRSL